MRFPGGIPDPPDLAFAAWCYRQGKDQLTRELLTELRRQADANRNNRGGGPDLSPADLGGRLKYDLTWITYHGLVSAFQGREDTLALEHGERLHSHFPDGLSRYPQAQEVIDDLKRRQKQGTFNPPAPPKLPEGYDTWTAEAKARFWVKEFQDINVRQMGQPGGVSFGMDERVRQVVALGEPALPVLFECLEKDDRLARVVSYFRDFRPSRKLHYVREGAWVAIHEILKTIPADVTAGIPYNTPDPERYRLLGAAAKKYWLANRGKSPQLRFYEALCDHKIQPSARFSALGSLLNDRRGWSRSGSYVPPWPQAPAKLADDLAHFNYPTVAEAIFQALDHDTRAPKDRPVDAHSANMIARHINESEDVYLRGLVALGDRGVMPELLRREQATGENFRLRLKLADALHRFGDSKPLARIADLIAAGKEPQKGLVMKDSWYIGDIEAVNFIRTLTEAGLPETEKALYAFARPEHPLHAFCAAQIARGSSGHDYDFCSHPYCLAFYRPRLRDTTPTGSTYEVVKDSIVEKSDQFKGYGNLSGELKDPANRRDRAEPRACDLAMMHLRGFVVGMPYYHPLLKDAPARFEANLKWLNRHQFRRATDYESLQLSPHTIRIIPDLKPLEQPATAADVAAGRAAFHLDGQGKRTDQKLPAWVVLKKDVQSNYIRRRGLIFQAEEATGQKHYGALFADGIRTVKPDEVDRVEPYAPAAPPARSRPASQPPPSSSISGPAKR